MPPALARSLFASLVVAASLVAVARVGAVGTRSFVLADATSLAAGELDRVEVRSDGIVAAGPERTRVELPNTPVAYALARAADGSFFVGTGNDGKILRVRGNDVTPFGETGSLVVSSLAIDATGNVLAGTLPGTAVLAFDASGTRRDLATLERTEHIWALVYDARTRTTYAGTGPEGLVYAIDAQGRASVYFDAPAAHVMSLALADDGALYVGVSEQALVYRVRGPGRVDVAYDLPGTEIDALAYRNGVLAIAANEFGDGTPIPTPTKLGAPPTPAAPARPRAGKGRVFRVDADGRSELVATNDDGHVTALALEESGAILAAIAKDGRVLRIDRDRAISTIVDVEERQVLALVSGGPGELAITTGDAGAFYRLGRGAPSTASWTSKVLDAEFNARWGDLRWRGEGALSFQTRSGDTERPDLTWSDWSVARTEPGPISSPRGRYLQLRARFDRDPAARFWSVTAYYLPQNQRPIVSDVAARPRGDAPTKAADANASPSAREDAPTASSTIRLTWKVANPDGDRIRYRLAFRAENQAVFRELLRESDVLTRTEWSWETNSVPDGYYRVRVEASDEGSNPEPYALRSTAVSMPILVDNGPPTVDSLAFTQGTVRGRATDSIGPIARIEVAIDSGEWRTVFPDDDLLDQATESFAVPLGTLAPGPHVVAVRAFDAAANVGSGELAIDVPATARPATR